MTGKMTCGWLVVVAVVVAGGTVRADPIAPHPAASAASAKEWTAQLGRFGESLVGEAHRARGEQVFALQDGQGHGIDTLVRGTGPDGKPVYKVVEVKTLQSGTDFRLSDTADGRQLSAKWTENRLTKAAESHPDPTTRKAVAEALEQFRARPESVSRELHGVSVGDNRYVIKRVDPSTGVLRAGEAADARVSDLLKRLAEKAGSEDVRRSAQKHLAEFDRLQAASRPQVVKGGDYAKELAKAAGVEESSATAALKEASEHVQKPGQSRWVKVGGKVFKFVGSAAGSAGVVIGVAVYTAEAIDIEARFEKGELTREQADAEHAKLAARTGGGAAGALGGMSAGALIGSFICPGPGTVAGGLIGAVAGAVGADIVMAATGLTDAVGEFLAPGVETARKAAEYAAQKGAEVTLAAAEQLKQWVGVETAEKAASLFGSSVKWAEKATDDTFASVKDKAVEIKNKAVELKDKAAQTAGEVGTAIRGTAVEVKDKTVELKDKAVEVTNQAGTAVKNAATDLKDGAVGKAQSGWRYIRRQLD